MLCCGPDPKHHRRYIFVYQLHRYVQFTIYLLTYLLTYLALFSTLLQRQIYT